MLTKWMVLAVRISWMMPTFRLCCRFRIWVRKDELLDIGYMSKDDPLYVNTRKFILSEYNPYFFKV